MFVIKIDSIKQPINQLHCGYFQGLNNGDVIQNITKDINEARPFEREYEPETIIKTLTHKYSEILKFTIVEKEGENES